MTFQNVFSLIGVCAALLGLYILFQLAKFAYAINKITRQFQMLTDVSLWAGLFKSWFRRNK
jgi:hypothetical protein